MLFVFPMIISLHKFTQFDGNSNPKEHIANLIETCSNDGTEGGQLVKQFIQTLKRISFD